MEAGVVSEIKITEAMRKAGNSVASLMFDFNIEESAVDAIYREMEQARLNEKPPKAAKVCLPETLDVDDDGYPSEDSLMDIAGGSVFIRDDVDAGKRWMLETFPKLAAEIGHGRCEIEDGVDFLGRPKKVIHYSTHGWSGCEDFICAVLSNPMLSLLYYASWCRGGHYTFEVVE